VHNYELKLNLRHKGMVLNVLEGLLKSVGRVVMRERTISRL